jgi:hypothetical protein
VAILIHVVRASAWAGDVQSCSAIMLGLKRAQVLVGSLVGWLDCSLVDLLVAWLVDWLVGWLVAWLVCW